MGMEDFTEKKYDFEKLKEKELKVLCGHRAIVNRIARDLDGNVLALQGKVKIKETDYRFMWNADGSVKFLRKMALVYGVLPTYTKGEPLFEDLDMFHLCLEQKGN